MVSFIKTITFKYIMYFEHIHSQCLPIPSCHLWVFFLPLDSLMPSCHICVYIYTFSCHIHVCVVSCINIQTRIHKLEKTFDICLSESRWFHLIWWLLLQTDSQSYICFFYKFLHQFHLKLNNLSTIWQNMNKNMFLRKLY